MCIVLREVDCVIDIEDTRREKYGIFVCAWVY